MDDKQTKKRKLSQLELIVFRSGGVAAIIYAIKLLVAGKFLLSLGFLEVALVGFITDTEIENKKLGGVQSKYILCIAMIMTCVLATVIEYQII